MDEDLAPETTSRTGDPVFESAEAKFDDHRRDRSAATRGDRLQDDAADVEEELSAAIGELRTGPRRNRNEVTGARGGDPGGPDDPAPVFGKRDPMEKAQRLARVLVSDIILYNPDRHHTASETGRVKEEFEEEIQKSWNEYVEQVGEEIANTTPFFNDALNEILAKGEKIF